MFDAKEVMRLERKCLLGDVVQVLPTMWWSWRAKAFQQLDRLCGSQVEAATPVVVFLHLVQHRSFPQPDPAVALHQDVGQ